MDPNETLARLRENAQWLAGHPNDTSTVLEVIGLWEALDGWISHGGFLPSDWQASREAH